MEEVVKTKSTSVKKKYKIEVLVADTIRGIVKVMNDCNVGKSSVISLIKENGQWILLYEKEL